MPVEVVEKFESRQVTTGQNPSVELRYVIRGTNDDVEARAALLAGSPATYDPWGTGWFFLPRDTVTIQPVGDELWEGIVRYGPVPQTEQSVFSFDTGGGTRHITHSLVSVARYALPSKTAPDFNGAIGVTNDSVEGVDITVPVYHFSETHYLPNETVTPAYRVTLFQLTGRVNSAPFKGFAAGEVLFLGAAGSEHGSGDWEITYRFAASPNVSNLTIGDITGTDRSYRFSWRQHVARERGWLRHTELPPG